MQLSDSDLILVTGATGLVGSHIAERFISNGYRVRALVRKASDVTLLNELGVELAYGDVTDADSLPAALDSVTVIIHCAAKVGDWGPVDDYRVVNVDGTRNLCEAGLKSGTLKRLIHIGSLGAYEARDHFGTDETEPLNLTGIDGYTVTKAESDELVRKLARDKSLPAIVLRPGFVYGPRDRTVLPRLLERLKAGQVKFLGSGEQLLNNIYVGHIVDAVFLAIENDDAIGEAFNLTDRRLVSRREFIGSIAEKAGYEKPTANVPLGFARLLAAVLEKAWRLLGKDEAPILSSARIKFLGLNLDFSTQKAQHVLGYAPETDFTDGISEAVEWCREQGMV